MKLQSIGPNAKLWFTFIQVMKHFSIMKLVFEIEIKIKSFSGVDIEKADAKRSKRMNQNSQFWAAVGEVFSHFPCDKNFLSSSNDMRAVLTCDMWHQYCLTVKFYADRKWMKKKQNCDIYFLSLHVQPIRWGTHSNMFLKIEVRNYMNRAQSFLTKLS